MSLEPHIGIRHWHSALALNVGIEQRHSTLAFVSDIWHWNSTLAISSGIRHWHYNFQFDKLSIDRGICNCNNQCYIVTILYYSPVQQCWHSSFKFGIQHWHSALACDIVTLAFESVGNSAFTIGAQHTALNQQWQHVMMTAIICISRHSEFDLTKLATPEQANKRKQPCDVQHNAARGAGCHSLCEKWASLN